MRSNSACETAMQAALRIWEQPWGRAWLLAVVAIPAMSLAGNQLLDALRSTIGSAGILSILALAVAAVAICACYPVVRWGTASTGIGSPLASSPARPFSR